MQLPQTPTDLITEYLTWSHKNINHNLDFVPADKLDWKPGGEAKSVLEIVNHATNTVNFFTGKLTGQEPAELTPATDAASAKNLITQVIEAHLAAVHSLTPEQMQETVALPFGDFPKGFIAGLPVVELINHHGQLTYVQELLGDGESHMVMN